MIKNLWTFRGFIDCKHQDLKKNKRLPLSLPRPRYPGEYTSWGGPRCLDGFKNRTSGGGSLDGCRMGVQKPPWFPFLLLARKMLAPPIPSFKGNERSDETWGPTTKTLSIQREDRFGTSSTQVRAGALGMRICYGVYGIRDKSASVTWECQDAVNQA